MMFHITKATAKIRADSYVPDIRDVDLYFSEMLIPPSRRHCLVIIDNCTPAVKSSDPIG